MNSAYLQHRSWIIYDEANFLLPNVRLATRIINRIFRAVLIRVVKSITERDWNILCEDILSFPNENNRVSAIDHGYIFVLTVFGFSRLPAPFCYQFKYSCSYATFNEHAWLLVRDIIARRLFMYKDFMFLFPALSSVSITYLLFLYSLLAGLQRYMLNNSVSSLTSALLYPKAESLKGG